MENSKFSENILELIRRTSFFLPPDVHEVLAQLGQSETTQSRAELAMNIIHHNIQLARQKCLPICQDTGFLSLYIHLPYGMNPTQIKTAISEDLWDPPGCYRVFLPFPSPESGRCDKPDLH